MGHEADKPAPTLYSISKSLFAGGVAGGLCVPFPGSRAAVLANCRSTSLLMCAACSQITYSRGSCRKAQDSYASSRKGEDVQESLAGACSLMSQVSGLVKALV